MSYFSNLEINRKLDALEKRLNQSDSFSGVHQLDESTDLTEKMAQLNNSYAVPSNKMAQLNNQNTLSSNKTAQLINQYTLPSNKTAQLSNSYALPSKTSAQLSDLYTVPSIRNGQVTNRHTVSSKKTNQMVIPDTLSSKRNVQQTNSYTVSSKKTAQLPKSYRDITVSSNKTAQPTNPCTITSINTSQPTNPYVIASKSYTDITVASNKTTRPTNPRTIVSDLGQHGVRSTAGSICADEDGGYTVCDDVDHSGLIDHSGLMRYTDDNPLKDAVNYEPLNQEKQCSCFQDRTNQSCHGNVCVGGHNTEVCDGHENIRFCDVHKSLHACDVHNNTRPYGVHKSTPSLDVHKGTSTCDIHKGTQACDVHKGTQACDVHGEFGRHVHQCTQPEVNKCDRSAVGSGVEVCQLCSPDAVNQCTRSRHACFSPQGCCRNQSFDRPSCNTRTDARLEAKSNHNVATSECNAAIMTKRKADAMMKCKADAMMESNANPKTKYNTKSMTMCDAASMTNDLGCVTRHSHENQHRQSFRAQTNLVESNKENKCENCKSPEGQHQHQTSIIDIESDILSELNEDISVSDGLRTDVADTSIEPDREITTNEHQSKGRRIAKSTARKDIRPNETPKMVTPRRKCVTSSTGSESSRNTRFVQQSHHHADDLSREIAQQSEPTSPSEQVSLNHQNQRQSLPHFPTDQL